MKRVYFMKFWKHLLCVIKKSFPDAALELIFAFVVSRSSALCCFLLRKMSIGKFNLPVSFFQVHFFQTKIFEIYFCFILHIWVRFDCSPIVSKFTKQPVAVQSEKTGCDEYTEDELKVSGKSLAKYPFHDKEFKRYLEDICSVNGWSD